jgi:threonine dehydratase
MSATIFLPANPHSVKRKNIAALGARIVEAGALRKTLCGQTLTF